MEELLATIVVGENPFAVRAIKPFGGGYVKTSRRENLVSDAVSALNFLHYGRNKIKFVGPGWVRDELSKRGFDNI